MDRTGRRAVIAAVSGQNIPELAAMLESLGYAVSGHARDAASAISMVRDFLPELIIADAVLPGMDGAALAGRIFSMPLRRYPAIILAALPGAMVSGFKPYENAGVRVLSKPLDASSLADAIGTLIPENRSLPPDKASRLDGLMDELGLPEHRGREYLKYAVFLAWLESGYAHSLKGRLYPAVGKKYGQTPTHTERAMRYAIDHAWRTGEIEKQHKIFGDTIDARRGKPTCGEMIARLADILRWEGRQ